MAALIVFSTFLLLGLGLIVSTILGLPGGWLILFVAVLLEYFDQSLGLGSESFGWGIIAIAAVIQLVAEGTEFLAGSMGAKYGGASKRGMWGAFIGGIVGAIFGTFLIPIPLFGSLMGSIGGSFVTAYIVEQRELDQTTALKSATGAALGRTFGVLSKIAFCVAVLTLLSGALAINYFL